MDKKAEILIPKGGAGEEPNLFVSVNGVNYLLPRGRKSAVPVAVAAELQRAWQAQEALDSTIDALLRQGK